MKVVLGRPSQCWIFYSMNALFLRRYVLVTLVGKSTQLSSCPDEGRIMHSCSRNYNNDYFYHLSSLLNMLFWSVGRSEPLLGNPKSSSAAWCSSMTHNSEIKIHHPMFYCPSSSVASTGFYTKRSAWWCIRNVNTVPSKYGRSFKLVYNTDRR